MTRPSVLVLMGLLAACDSSDEAPVGSPPPVSAGDRVVPGSATTVSPGVAADGGRLVLRLDDPTRSAHVGRAPRRLDIDQFRASLEQLLGARWTGPQTVITSEAPSGVRFEADADLIEFFAATLGRPDYVTTTSEVLDPTVTFSKLSADAARSVCARAIPADVARPAADRLLFVAAQETDALPAAEPAIRRNIAALALRLWGFEMAPDSETVTGVLGVFRVATAQPGATPLDGWRAVCIDVATDNRFLSY